MVTGNTCTHRQWKAGFLFTTDIRAALSNSDHKSYQVPLCKTHYQKDEENMWPNQGKKTKLKREQLHGLQCEDIHISIDKWKTML